MTAVMVEEQEILSVMAIVIEPIVSENLPFGFDSSTCRSVYVGNIHLQVTDSLLHEVFQSIGPVILTSLWGIFAQRSRMLLCLLFFLAYSTCSSSTPGAREEQ
ncbi:uncharacterized protein LOC104585111 isoform X6 [Brachypodium distachyon]|uniref:uncharacterized protein LOC104585111 isoform X6 n=1 Tax=Brachypodium distachyon TaxID=15368 RepID=UPI00071DDEC0|nr:uncharacterized protein LOC104585111 isoform X6 [Brachypodium distachyon]|eukprot:XP_014757601.1 uncharacterized protein LOC104585111 isoform X6 [Brachypodium distachyon]